MLMEKKLTTIFTCLSLLGGCGAYTAEKKIIGTPPAFGNDSHYTNFMRYVGYMSKNYAGFNGQYSFVIDDVEKTCGETLTSRSDSECKIIVGQASSFIVFTSALVL